MITALAAGGTAAYLTDFETATNSFTVGKVDIDLDEPNWKPEDNTDLVPTQVIRKDPYVANKGVKEAFVYLEVSVQMCIRDRSVIIPGRSRDPAKTVEVVKLISKQIKHLISN